MAEAGGTEVGARIAMVRKMRQLTQHGLAAQAHVSYSLLTKVESGNRPATPAFAAACARALGVGIADLTGKPEPSKVHDGQLPSQLARVQTQLDLYDLDPDETIQPRTLRELRHAGRRVNKVAQAANYERMASMLPSLLSELHTAAHTWTEVPRGSRTAPQLRLGCLEREDFAASKEGFLA